MILLVEDDDTLRPLFAHVLRSAGYIVLEASDDEEARRSMAQHPEQIDLLISDVILPGMNGRDLAASLRASSPGLRVLLLSGHPAETLMLHCRLTPGLPFLEKPFQAADLKLKVREVLAETPLIGRMPVPHSGETE